MWASCDCQNLKWTQVLCHCESTPDLQKCTLVSALCAPPLCLPSMRDVEPGFQLFKTQVNSFPTLITEKSDKFGWGGHRKENQMQTLKAVQGGQRRKDVWWQFMITIAIFAPQVPCIVCMCRMQLRSQYVITSYIIGHEVKSTCVWNSTDLITDGSK